MLEDPPSSFDSDDDNRHVDWRDQENILGVYFSRNRDSACDNTSSSFLKFITDYMPQRANHLNTNCKEDPIFQLALDNIGLRQKRNFEGPVLLPF